MTPTAAVPSSGSRVSRPGGRSARVTTSVLRATLEAFAEGGWDAVRIDAIAESAGVHKTTVYRRWPTRGALIAAALTAMPFRTPETMTPDTGSLRADLQVMVEELEAGWQEPRMRRISRNLTRASHVPEIAVASTVFWSTRVDLVAALITNAIRRGEVPPQVDAEVVASMLVGALKLHVVERDIIPEHSWLFALIDAIVRAAGAAS